MEINIKDYIDEDFTTLSDEVYDLIRYKIQSTKSLNLDLTLHFYSKLLKRCSESDKAMFQDCVDKLLDSDTKLSSGQIKSIVHFYLEQKDLRRITKILEYSLSKSTYLLIFKFLVVNRVEDEWGVTSTLLSCELNDSDYIEIFSLDFDKSQFFRKMVNELPVLSTKLYDLVKLTYSSKLLCQHQTSFGFRLNSSVVESICRKIEAHISQDFIKSTTNYEVVIDGANVGYYSNKGNIIYEDIKQLASKFTDKRVLVVLNKRHKGKVNFTQKNLFCKFTPRGTNDDYYWLYVSLTQQIPVVTHDKLSNVKSRLNLSEKEMSALLLWTTYKFIKYTKEELFYPPLTIEINDNCVHIPSQTGSYLCVDWSSSLTIPKNDLLCKTFV